MLEFFLLKSPGGFYSKPTIILYGEKWQIEKSDKLLDESGAILLFDTDENLYQKLKEKFKNEVILIKPDQPEEYHTLLESIRGKRFLPLHIIHLWSRNRFINNDEEINAEIEKSLFSVFHLCKALMNHMDHKIIEKIKLLYLYQNSPDDPQPIYAAVSGFAKSVRLENPNLFFKTISFSEIPESAAEISDIINNEFHKDDEEEIDIQYQSQQRYIKTISEIETLPQMDLKGLLKEKGVYLITGGAGGIGLIFAQYLAKEVKARLALIGRSELKKEQIDIINEIKKSGAEVIYIRGDISKKDQVEKSINQVNEKFGNINGIIHMAGVLRDSLIQKKNMEDISEVLSPKVFGTLYLDEITKGMNLDFFALFSSIVAVTGNAGQSDYAYANSFMDNFAHWRETQVPKGNRYGKTFSINWSLWQNGNMSIDNQIQQWMQDKLGIVPIPSEAGFNAFVEGLSLKQNNFMVIKGYRDKVRDALLNGKASSKGISLKLKAQSTNELHKELNYDENEFIGKIQNDLIFLSSLIVKIHKEKILSHEKFSKYGFDSLSLTELANTINRKFKTDITPAIFFEYPSIESFSKFLSKKYFDRLKKYYEKIPYDLFLGKGEIKTIPFIKKNLSKFKPVAIIGMSGVMPQSENLEIFWKHLESGDDLIVEVPEDRWDWKTVYGDPIKEGNRTKCKWGGFIENVDKFDNRFFGISPREAELMDPQQRLFLQTVWETIEDAGYKASDLSGTDTGLFVGVATDDYHELFNKHGLEIEAHASTGTALSVLANRISFLLNIHGPSEPIDTACSSSLVAIHRAVKSIQDGDCEMAIAGGVNVMITPTVTISFSKAGMLSQDGRCKTFDKKADGYVRGEGSGAVLLKSLQKAIDDNDHIYAVIKGSAINHGGNAASLTAPNPNAQARLLVNTYENAGISPDTISYIETHGTGTILGDPVEINALKNAFSELYTKYDLNLPKKPHCGLGALKTNIGHLETASGIASIFKVILSMKNRKIPANINFSEVNPYIELSGTPFYLITETREWKPLLDSEGNPIPKRAGISSFGFGGVNAHIILEEYCEESKKHVTNQQTVIIVLSAKNEERLKIYAKKMVSCLDNIYKNDISLSSFAYTLQIGREAMESRFAAVVNSFEELKEILSNYAERKEETDIYYAGNIKHNKHSNHEDKSAENKDIHYAINENRLIDIAKFWVKGSNIDWKLLYNKIFPKRISLPSYPFAKERFWIPLTSEYEHSLEMNCAGLNSLHPLIDKNISNFNRIRFTKKLTLKEFYYDTCNLNNKVFPGIAFLEMARGGAEIALEQRVIKITDVVWAKPVIYSDIPLDIALSLYTENKAMEEDKIFFEISSEKNHKKRVLVQGNLVYERSKPVLMEKDNEEYVLNPFVINDLLQKAIEKLGIKSINASYSPYKLAELDVIKPISHECHARAIPIPDDEKGIKRFNMEIIDQNGQVIIRIKDLFFKLFKKSSEYSI